MEINTIDDFFEFIKTQTTARGNLMYRGVRHSEYKLIPSVGRLRTYNGELLKVDEEKALFETFHQKQNNPIKHCFFNFLGIK
jgi:hypothetical protein